MLSFKMAMLDHQLQMSKGGNIPLVPSVIKKFILNITMANGQTETSHVFTDEDLEGRPLDDCVVMLDIVFNKTVGTPNVGNTGIGYTIDNDTKTLTIIRELATSTVTVNANIFLMNAGITITRGVEPVTKVNTTKSISEVPMSGTVVIAYATSTSTDVIFLSDKVNVLLKSPTTIEIIQRSTNPRKVYYQLVQFPYENEFIEYNKLEVENND